MQSEEWSFGGCCCACEWLYWYFWLSTDWLACSVRGVPGCLACSIIDSRRSQTNFQLIVITHEEEFVDMLARHVEGGGGGPARGMGHYFKVSREEMCVE